jgi:hypothetical protein
MPVMMRPRDKPASVRAHVWSAAPQQGTPTIRDAAFCRVERSPLQDGMIFVALTATTVDEEEPQLLDQKIATEKVTTIAGARWVTTAKRFGGG